jgi:lipoprotein-anchoring transpeptidase ErfK/SrfK
VTAKSLRLAVALTSLLFISGSVLAQFPRQLPRLTPTAAPRQQQQQGQPGSRTAPKQMQAPRATTRPVNQPMRKASELISRQEPIRINQRAYDGLTQETSRVQVSLSKQRAYLLNGEEVAIDSPISSGKRAGSTPTGSFNIMQKNKDHRSNLYGDFVDGNGRVVRGGVSTRIDSAPSGTRFLGAPMKWFMRLTGDGVGMHVGILPGYPASHGCIRMPPQAAEMFFAKVKLGTPVQVVR